MLLDEIGEMPLELQPKLLRLLQERVYYRVGSEKPVTADFRLIASTNRNPHSAIQAGALREDLYYRLNTIEILVPPLRERPEDILSLAEHFLRLYATKYQRTIHAIAKPACEKMMAYAWPGNVRQLQNAIERAVLMCKGDLLEISPLALAQPISPVVAADDIAPVSTATSAISTAPVAAASVIPELPTVEHLCRQIIQQVPAVKSGEPPRELFHELEVYLAHAAVERTRGNKQAAANLLGIYRPRLYNLLKPPANSPSNSTDSTGKQEKTSANQKLTEELAD